MKNALIFFAFLLFSGCKSIDKLTPNQTETFLKFYSETDQMNAKDLLVLDDGYLVLGTDTDNSSILLKTDLSGNKIWAISLTDFQGKSLTLVEDGYIIIGDGIYDTNLTLMQLIKTDISGTITNSTALGQDTTFIGHGYYHGTALTYTSANEVIALGYVDNPISNAYVLLMGFNLDLSNKWFLPRSFKVTGEDKIPYPSIYESNNGDLTWLNFTESAPNNKLDFATTPPDTDIPNANRILFSTLSLVNTPGDFVKTSVGYVATQTIRSGTQNTIGITSFNQNILSENTLSFEEGNYQAVSVTNTPNGLLLAALTTTTARTDSDLMLLEVGYDLKVKTDGININYGGLGNEIPVRIRNAKDGGYAILGTLINTKGAQQLFLLKTNKKGALD